MKFRGFELDEFQVRAIRAVDEGRSIIVAAPTGAGKTLIAEYAIDKYVAEGKSIIYTAPIKALSNQKFRDFSRQYPGKVGIMTGDVILNPEAPVLIMTTEIFRNIIFDEGGERLRHIKYVILDEIHFIDDVERGTVWEECLIFAPDHIRFVCLSATVPNLRDFAAWISDVREGEMEAIVEEHRPVPLKTKIFVHGHGVRNLDFAAKLKAPQRGVRRGRPRVDILELVKHLRNHDQLPALYFVFSRAGCREYALRCGDVHLLTREEGREVAGRFDALCGQFSVTRAPVVETMRRLLRSGVAYHHAGVLPAMKEILERLYTLGLIKLLFTTETFAVGINMPARSVVFDSTLKYDGVSLRPLRAREFHQMAGRAGRRGIDEVGYAYPVVVPGDFQFANLKHMLSTNVESIESQFRLSYSSILNLYEKFGDLIYEVVDRSFSNHTAVTQVGTMEGRIGDLNRQVKELRATRCHHGDFGHIERYIKTKREFNRAKHSLQHASRGKQKKKGSGKSMSRLRREMEKSPCHRCKKKRDCRRAAISIEENLKTIAELEARVEEVRDFQKAALKRKMRLLRRLGYIDDRGLLPRGEVASRIFGYELQFTELYFDGFFEALPAEEINLVAQAVVHESRRTTTYRKVDEKNIRKVLLRAGRFVQRIRKAEEEAGVAGPVKPFDTAMSRALLEWCRGCDFDSLKSFTTEDDGDIVRSFRLTVDFLRQMRRAIAEPMFQKKLEGCISLIYRDVVDAEAQLKTEI